MRKTLLILSLLLSVTIAAGQDMQLRTKKYKIADFPLKTTKVVLTGNDMVDAVFRKEVSERWLTSPFEFCTQDEFEAVKGYDTYYFLLFTEGTGSDAGITFLSVVKGGPEAGRGIAEMLQVVSVPYAPTGGLSIRGLIYLPALLDIIQAYIPRAIDDDRTAYGGLSGSLAQSRGLAVRIGEEDIAERARGKVPAGIHVTETDEVDDRLDRGGDDVLLGYVVAPEQPVKGSACYKMLVGSESHRLFYYRRAKVSGPADCGFLADELRRFARGRAR